MAHEEFLCGIEENRLMKQHAEDFRTIFDNRVQEDSIEEELGDIMAILLTPEELAGLVNIVSAGFDKLDSPSKTVQ